MYGIKLYFWFFSISFYSLCMLSIMSVEKLLDCNAESVEDSFKSEVM